MSSTPSRADYRVNWWRLGGVSLAGVTSLTIATIAQITLTGIVSTVLTGLFGVLGLGVLLLVLFVLVYEWIKYRQRLNRWIDYEKRRDSREFKD